MSKRTPAGDKGTADRIPADDGGYWVRLVTWQALDREGLCMEHCVGDGDYDGLVGGEDLHDDAIWSLRDRDGRSVLTVRIRRQELDYAKGPSNHPPGRGAAMQVRHLVAAFKAAGYPLGVCGGTEIVLLKDGRTFRHDRLPPEAQAERNVASGPFGLDRYQVTYGQAMFRRAGEERYRPLGEVTVAPTPPARPSEGALTVGVDTQPPARTVASVHLDRGTIHARMSDGESIPLAYVMDLPEGTTVTGFEDMAVNLVVRLSNGDFHEVPHPEPRAVHHVTLASALTHQVADGLARALPGIPVRIGFPGVGHGAGGGGMVPRISIQRQFVDPPLRFGDRT